MFCKSHISIKITLSNQRQVDLLSPSTFSRVNFQVSFQSQTTLKSNKTPHLSIMVFIWHLENHRIDNSPPLHHYGECTIMVRPKYNHQNQNLSQVTLATCYHPMRHLQYRIFFFFLSGQQGLFILVQLYAHVGAQHSLCMYIYIKELVVFFFFTIIINKYKYFICILHYNLITLIFFGITT